MAAGSTALANKEFIWGVTGAHGSGSALYQIHPTSGKVLGKVGNTGANALAGISIHPATRMLYAANGAAAPTGLFTLDKTTGAATLIGSSGKVVPSMSFDGGGVLYAWDQVGKKLMTLNLSTGAATVLNGDLTPAATGLVFGPDGTLYLKGANNLHTLDKATGLKATGPVTLTPPGGIILDNLLVFSTTGVLYSGKRTPAASAVGTTSLYVVNPVTGTVTFSCTVPLAITGMTFDVAAPPVFKVSGKKKITTSKSSVKLKGTGKSLVPLNISTKGASAKVKNGKWQIKAKLKPGKNTFKLLCDDGLGQKKTAKVVVIRES